MNGRFPALVLFCGSTGIPPRSDPASSARRVEWESGQQRLGPHFVAVSTEERLGNKGCTVLATVR